MSIQSEISRLSGAKSSIEGSLTEMGVEVPSGAKMETLASLLESEVVGHIQNFDNPHYVTASQIGAATSSDIESYVVANPTLAGTESNLSAIQIGDIAYAIPSGGGISGPSTSTSGHIPVFSNSSGNILEDGYGIVSAISSDSSSVPRTDAVYNELIVRVPSKVLTSQQYAALSSAEKLEDIVYIITDDETNSTFQPLIIANGILKCDGSGNVAAASAGVDFQIPLIAGTDYTTPSALSSVYELADSKYAKPSTGIPASDLAPDVIPTVPFAYASNPEMDGTASPGSSGSWAKGDHVHPSDTTKLGTSGDGSNVTAAFNAASSRTNISTGEKLTVIFGKIAKWFADLGAAAFRSVDSVPTDNSTNLVESGGIKSALTHDIANIIVTGSTNTTGSTIGKDTFFYLNGTLCRAKTNIAVNEAFTLGTNYIVVYNGGLNEIVPGLIQMAALQTGCSGWYETVGRMVVLNATVTKPNADWSLLYQLPAPKDGALLTLATVDGKSFLLTHDGFLQYRGGTFSESYTFSAAYISE